MKRRTGSGALWLCVALACGGDDDTTTGQVPAGSDTSDAGQLTGETTAEPTTAGDVCEAGQHTGEATYYGGDGSGNCSFDAGSDILIAAMNDADYANAAACGACVEIAGPDATIVARIVDRCPECSQGDIDLGEAAFAKIARKELGRVPISWRYVSCPVEGPLVYRF
jgi:expansin (peptidoglycan-binding protein)